MNPPVKLTQSKVLSDILDENFSPVARMRLFSRGVQTNNRLSKFQPATADKGCLACGNCIDACPVVREKKHFEFLQNKRTSMSLETIVGEDCRRCYKCVKACPQVSKETKEYVTGFRRAEKFVHATMASAIFTLMATGIFLYHYRPHIPELHATLYGALHIIAGIVLILVPFLYWKVDKGHMKRTLTLAWKKDREADRAWWQEFKAFLAHPVGKTLPKWREFNPYHKFWIRYLCCALGILTLTGIGNFLGEPVLGEGLYAFNYALHSLTALCTDLLVLTHLYFKLLRWIIRMCADMAKSWKKTHTFDYPFLYDKNPS